jgi:hypothetical protein
MTERQHGEQRYEYDRTERTIKLGKRGRKWALHAVPPAVMYEWIREDRVFKGLFEDYCNAIRGDLK